MTIENIHCRSSGYEADEFLAYCRSKQYGDYEHGALYYGLESTGENIRNAQVIFLGSSKTQAGFSSKAVRAYFGKRGIRFFVLGFGYAERSRFELAVLKRWAASPKVIVINADPFFSDTLSVPAQEALDGHFGFLWRLGLKFMFQRVHRAVCYSVPSICPENEPAIFRSARDGEWNWIGPYTPERAVPFDRSGRRLIAAEEFEKAKQIGEEFLREIGLDRRCVVLTGTPDSDLDFVGIAEQLAAALKTSSLFPPTGGLSTLDGGHLNLAGAERWSGDLVEALSPILGNCLVTSPNTAPFH
jgi:hypothetical protein